MHYNRSTIAGAIGERFWGHKQDLDYVLAQNLECCCWVVKKYLRILYAME